MALLIQLSSITSSAISKDDCTNTSNSAQSKPRSMNRIEIKKTVYFVIVPLERRRFLMNQSLEIHETWQENTSEKEQVLRCKKIKSNRENSKQSRICPENRELQNIHLLKCY